MRVFLRMGAALTSAALFLLAQPAAVVEKAERAQLWMAQQRFADAAGLYEELTRALPGNAGMLMNLGMARHMAGQDAAAIAPLEAALKIQPIPPAFLFLGASYLRINQPAKAVPPLRRFLQLDPAHAEARRMIIDAAMTSENHAEAVIHLRKLAEADAAQPMIWANLARSYSALASGAFDKVPAGSGYFFALTAESRSQQNQNRAAFYFYRQALSVMPKLRGVHAGLAGVYERTGQPEWAAQERAAEASLGGPNCKALPGSLECLFAAGQFLRITQSALATPEAYYWRARAYEALSRNAVAKLAALPPSAEGWRFQAELARDAGRHAEAVKAWRAAIELTPQPDAGLELELAASLMATRDYDAARAIAEKYLAADPAAPDVNFLMGDLLLNQQQAAEAIPYLEKATAILPARASLGRALLLAGRPADAVAHLQAALPLDTDASLHFQLVRALQGAGRAAEAKVALAKYQALQAKLGAATAELEEKLQITAPGK